MWTCARVKSWDNASLIILQRAAIIITIYSFLPLHIMQTYHDTITEEQRLVFSTYREIRDAWKKSGGGETEKAALLQFMDLEAYRDLPYCARNEGWVTSSKIGTYSELPYAAKLQYEDGVEMPWSDKDCFVRGRALDDLKTHGIEYFESKYISVDRRTKAGKEAAEAAEQRGAFVVSGGVMDKVKNAHAESGMHPLFPKEWRKRNIIWLWGGKIPCKAELDHFDPQSRIVDLKFMDNLTRFIGRANMYAVQMGFYYQAVLEADMLKLPVDLCVVDAGTNFARSHVFRWEPATLDGMQATVSDLVHRYHQSMETGVFPDLGAADGSLEILKAYWESDYYPLLPNRHSQTPTIL